MAEQNLDLSAALEVLSADGVTLELLRFDGEAAHLALVLVDPDCAECVLPRELLEPVVLDLLRANSPGLRSVQIVDPRE